MPALISSKQNARVRDLRVALLSRRRSDVVAIEGVHLLEEALRTDLTIDAVFLREDQVHLSEHLPLDVEVVLLSHAAFDSASATETSQGVAALLRPPELPYLPRRGDLVLIAAQVQDPGNLGTLIRSAEAFGAKALLLAENTVDPWNGKSLRASAGSAFRMPMPRLNNSLLAAMRTVGIRLLAAVAATGTPAHEADMRGGCALLIGNEGAGLSPAMLALADERVMLATTGPTESLNAAIAGSLLLYEASRQRAYLQP